MKGKKNQKKIKKNKKVKNGIWASVKWLLSLRQAYIYSWPIAKYINVKGHFGIIKVLVEN
jgi:hypothetical protein